MFLIEDLIKVANIVTKRLKFTIRIDNDGYRIVINRYTPENEEDRRKFFEERRIFINMLEREKNIHILRICDGHQYVIKAIVIIKSLYDGENIYLGLPSKIEKIENISKIQKEAIATKMNIKIEDI